MVRRGAGAWRLRNRATAERERRRNPARTGASVAGRSEVVAAAITEQRMNTQEGDFKEKRAGMRKKVPEGVGCAVALVRSKVLGLEKLSPFSLRY
jgi:hypothetical protein